MIDSVSWICRHALQDLLYPPATAAVRDTDAPSGSWTAMKKAPWSSSGRKPVGVVRAAK